MNAEEWVESEFPTLRFGAFQVTSPLSRRYHCIAWAAGRNDKWWWPVGACWPGRQVTDESLGTFVEAFSKLGYLPSDSDGFEGGIEKVAILSMGEAT